MRKLTAVVCLALAGACGGETEVLTVDEDGNVVGTMNVSPEELAKARSGEDKDLRAQMLLSGQGAVANCAGDEEPYGGETVMRRSYQQGGACTVFWAHDTGGGYGQLHFSFDLAWTKWYHDGSSIDDTVRSAQVRATNAKATQTYWCHNNMASGGCYFEKIPAGQVRQYDFFATATQCPAGQNCTTPPGSASSHGIVYTD